MTRSLCCTLHGARSVTCFILGFSLLGGSSCYLPYAPSPDIKPFAGQRSAFLGSVNIPARGVAWSDREDSMGVLWEEEKKSLRVLCYSPEAAPRFSGIFIVLTSPEDAISHLQQRSATLLAKFRVVVFWCLFMFGSRV